MKKLLHIYLVDGRIVLINEEHVCSIENSNTGCILKMSNGDEYICKSPTYSEWEADLFVQKD